MPYGFKVRITQVDKGNVGEPKYEFIIKAFDSAGKFHQIGSWWKNQHVACKEERGRMSGRKHTPHMIKRPRMFHTHYDLQNKPLILLVFMSVVFNPFHNMFGLK